MSERDQIDVWIRKAQRGDRPTLAKLLAAFHPQLRARAEARMDPAITAKFGPDDIIQEVYLDVARRIDRFEDRGPGSFLNWLHATLDQKLVDARRVVHRHVRDIDREVPAAAGTGSNSYWNLLDHVYADSATPSRVVRREEAFSALLTCISDLSEAHRQVIQLRYMEDLPVEEVATRLGKSKAAVNALCGRALEALRQAMDRLGEFTHGV